MNQSSENIWTNELNPFQKFKVLCHYDRMLKIPSGNFAPPVNVALDILQGTHDHKRCGGLSCNFCMSNLEDKGQEATLPHAAILEIPKFFRDWGVLSVCLAGHHSDPLMYHHSKLCTLLRGFYRNDIEVGFVTNGIGFDELMVEEVARSCKWTGVSVNAGCEETYMLQTGALAGVWGRVLNNIVDLTNYCKSRRIVHPVGFKFLITDDNYGEITQAVILAKKLGCRQVQVRPCELPEERRRKIDVEVVENQLRAAREHEVPGVFEVFGIREKFTSNLSKMTPRRCIATPLGSTWKADGDVVICPDRRWSAHQPNMVLGNFLTDGLEGIRRKWGGPEHRAMIAEANKRIHECIRCTAYQWHNLYEHTVVEDDMDLRLI
jgi:MoaA/NifB/PqqE/SkfB family radical SAM enzyme